LPTMILWEEEGQREESIPWSDAMWDEAPESTKHSWLPGSSMFWRAVRRARSSCCCWCCWGGTITPV
jgi:hypothetical protein